MTVTAKYKKINDKNYTEAQIKIPDQFSYLFEKYQLDMIEYPEYESMALFFAKKDRPDVDVVSHTIDRHKIQLNIKQGFERAFEKLVSNQE